MSQRKLRVCRHSLEQEIARAEEVEGPEFFTALHIKPGAALVCGEREPSCTCVPGGVGAKAEPDAQSSAGLGGQSEQVVSVAGNRFFGYCFSIGGVLHPQVEPDSLLIFAWQRGIRAKHYYVRAWILAQLLQGGPGQGPRLSRRQLLLDSRHVFGRDHAQVAVGAQLRVEHFRKDRREPIVLRTAG